MDDTREPQTSWVEMFSEQGFTPRLFVVVTLTWLVALAVVVLVGATYDVLVLLALPVAILTAIGASIERRGRAAKVPAKPSGRRSVTH